MGLFFQSVISKANSNSFSPGKRSTSKWSDMFGGNKNAVYGLRKIKADLPFGTMLGRIFQDNDEVQEYLEEE